jgi:hypothetical protein
MLGRLGQCRVVNHSGTRQSDRVVQQGPCNLGTFLIFEDILLRGQDALPGNSHLWKRELPSVISRVWFNGLKRGLWNSDVNDPDHESAPCHSWVRVPPVGSRTELVFPTPVGDWLALF